VGLGIDELTEVGVFGEEHTILLDGPLDDGLVGCAARELDDGCDVIAFGSERADDAEVATLVGEETRLLGLRRGCRWGRPLRGLRRRRRI
jgi:hypothetical protein